VHSSQEPSARQPHPEPWSWLAGAREAGDEVVLLLANDKPVTLVLRCDAATRERVRGWLADDRLLR
jgi:hypothetical protein